MLFRLPPNCILMNTATAKKVPFKFSRREVLFIFMLSGLSSGVLVVIFNKKTPTLQGFKGRPKGCSFPGTGLFFFKIQEAKNEENPRSVSKLFAEIICVGIKPNRLQLISKTSKINSSSVCSVLINNAGTLCLLKGIHLLEERELQPWHIFPANQFAFTSYATMDLDKTIVLLRPWQKTTFNENFFCKHFILTALLGYEQELEAEFSVLIGFKILHEQSLLKAISQVSHNIHQFTDILKVTFAFSPLQTSSFPPVLNTTLSLQSEGQAFRT